MKNLFPFLLLLCSLFAVSPAHAVGESATPNPVGRFCTYIENRIGLTPADDAIMDQVEAKITAFRLWAASYATGDVPDCTVRQVRTGAYAVSPGGGSVTWPGSFSNLPVANNSGDVGPHIAPGPLPAWLSGYTGGYSTPAAVPDTAWTTIATNKISSRLQLDRTLMTLVTVNETFKSSADPASHLAGRDIRVNPDLWAVATDVQRTNEMNRALMISLNVPLQPLPYNVSSLMHLTGQNIGNAVIPNFDRDALFLVWLGTGGQFKETWTYPMPVTFAPVP